MYSTNELKLQTNELMKVTNTLDDWWHWGRCTAVNYSLSNVAVNAKNTTTRIPLYLDKNNPILFNILCFIEWTEYWCSSSILSEVIFFANVIYFSADCTAWKLLGKLVTQTNKTSVITEPAEWYKIRIARYRILNKVVLVSWRCLIYFRSKTTYLLFRITFERV